MSKRRLVVLFALICTLVILPLTVGAAEATEGWVQNADKSWSYIEDGAKIKSDFLYEDDGDVYYFDIAGKMVTDWVQVNRASVWGDDEYRETWYYFNADGKAASGKVGNYYFSYEGQMLTNQVVYEWNAETQKDVWYVARDNGKLVALPTTDGWVEYDGYWYCIYNGAPLRGGVYQVSNGGKQYVFDHQGRLLENDCMWMQIYNEQTGWEDGYIAADANGVLLTNTWYQLGFDGAGDEIWMYFGKDGFALTGKQTIGTSTYFFESDGWMITDDVHYYYNYETSTGEYYVIAENGKATKLKNNDWTQVNGEWYYLNGHVYSNGTYTINGKSYLFEDYKLLVNYNDGDRRTDKNGALLKNAWYYNAERKGYEYYDASGYRLDYGLHEINGVYYYFENGLAVTNYARRAYDSEAGEYVWYYFGANNKGVKVADGWLETDNYGWMYFEKGEPCYEGIHEIGGKAYGFSYYGLVEDGVVYHYDSTPEYPAGYYLTNAGGVVVANPGWQTVGGGYVYIKTNGCLHTGWFYNGGNWYYLTPTLIHDQVFTQDGRTYYANATGATTDVVSSGLYRNGINSYVFIENGVIITSEWRKIDGEWYYFDDSGYMLRNTVAHVGKSLYLFDATGAMYDAGWIQFQGDWYYAEASGKLVTGVKKLDGQTYIFSDSGWMYSSQAITRDGTWYLLGTEGQVIVSGAQPKTGWLQYGNDWYYVSSAGYLYEGGTYYINGTLYAFDWEGIMVTNDFYYGHYFGANGKAVSGWFQVNRSWYYANEYDNLVSGITTIGGNEYLFDDNGKLMTNVTTIYDAELITTNADGVVVYAEDAADGWHYYDGNAYYIKNGALYQGWKGDYYLSNGRLVLDNIVWNNDKAYYVNEYGKCLKNQWIDRWGEYALAKADGSLYCNEWYGDYYFGDDCTMYHDGWYTVDGVEYYFDADGKAHEDYYEEEPLELGDGWQYVDGEYYYYYGGRYLTGSWKLQGKWYYFFSDGTMFSDGWMNNRYYNASGAMAEHVGWAKVEGEWVYFNRFNQLVTGWIYDGGSKYYVDWKYEYDAATDEYNEAYYMVTGYYAIDGKLYWFNSAGVCEGTYGVKNGWYLAGSDYYYFENGKLTDAYSLYLNGTWYAFEGGKMVTNGAAYCDDGEYRYFGADGKQVKTQGWINTEYGWVYVQADGTLCSSDYSNYSVYLIKGVEYFFIGIYWLG